MCKNEDFWIHYVIRDLLKVFPMTIILDTGSTDKTKEIIKRTEEKIGIGKIQLIEENYGNDGDRIGNGRNIMRQVCPTHWMFLIDGDEIWLEDRLRRLLEFEIEPNKEIVMVGWWKIDDVNGQLKLRTNDMANRDGLIGPNVKWTRLDYPFEGYRLVEDYVEKGLVQYIPAHEVYGWHLRDTQRSSDNDNVYFRQEKAGYYPYNGPFEDPPEGWLGEIDEEFCNRYICTT